MTSLAQAIATRATLALRLHYAWVVVGVIFLALLAASGIRATIWLAISVNIALYGLIGPFSAATMQRFGIRPVVLGALALHSVPV